MEGKNRKSLDVMFVVYLIATKGPWKLRSHQNTMENHMSVNTVETNLHTQAPCGSTRTGSTFSRETAKSESSLVFCGYSSL